MSPALPAGRSCRVTAVVCVALVLLGSTVCTSSALNLRHHLARAVTGLRGQQTLSVVDFQEEPLPASWGVCNQYGSNVHLCKVNNVLYQGGSIPTIQPDVPTWQDGTDIPFSVSDEAEQIRPLSLNLPGPCAETTYDRCRANRVTLQPLAAPIHQELCANATLYNDPIILVYRNFMNTVHWLSDQVAPFYLALQEFGLTGTPVQVITLDEDRYAHWKTVPELLAQRDADWARLAGRNVSNWWPLINTSFCAPWAILGSSGHLITSFDVELPLASVLNNTARYQGFADWMLSRFNVSRKVQLDFANPVITIPDRSGAVQRRIENYDEVLSIARSYTSHAARVKFEQMSVADQLQLAANTDVFMAVHGAALAWLAFLPPWGIVVELKPYGYGTQFRDFYHGLCSWARLLRITHLSWHNRNASASIPHEVLEQRWYGKDYHTIIDPGNATWILGTAVHMAKLAPQERNLNTCVSLNQPNEVPLMALPA